MNKIAVYTCIVGEYDDLLQPEVVADNFDYICFVKHGTATTKKMGMAYCAPLPSQYAALACLKEITQEEVSKMVNVFKQRRDVFIEGINQIPNLSC